MTRQCLITKKLPQSGHIVSHSKRKIKRKFRPNVRKTGVYSEILRRYIKLKITPHGMRIVEARGGIDSYVLNLKASEICPEIRKLKKELLYRSLYCGAVNNQLQALQKAAEQSSN